MNPGRNEKQALESKTGPLYLSAKQNKVNSSLGCSDCFTVQGQAHSAWFCR